MIRFKRSQPKSQGVGRRIRQALRVHAKTVDLSGLGLQELPDAVLQMPWLSSLDLSKNRLGSLPDALSQLHGLRVLRLSDNQLRHIPECVCRLGALRTLELRDNPIATVPACINWLGNLRVLDLAGACLDGIADELAQLDNLADLRLTATRGTPVPLGLARLGRLIRLALCGFKLQELPLAFLGLRGLRHLDLRDNLLSAIPPEVGALDRLSTLDLRENRLTTVPHEIGRLVHLRHVRLHGNPLRTLPPSFEQLKKLVEPPRAIVAQGMKQTLAFYRNSGDDSKPQWSAKVLLMGSGRVGKTSVLRSLLQEPFDPKQSSTYGIDPRVVELAHPDRSSAVRMTLNVWDFGGQEIQHALHQFFLSNGGLYVLAWTPRQSDDEIAYWMDMIVSRSPGARVVVVCTRADEYPLEQGEDLQSARFWLPRFRALAKRYPQITAGCAVSNRDGTGVDVLKSMIASTSSGLDVMGYVCPPAWANALQEIRRWRVHEKVIAAATVRERLATLGLDNDDIETLLRFCHELGELLYYHDDPLIRERIVLDPRWATQSISYLLRSPRMESSRGLLQRDEIEDAWKSVGMESPPKLDEQDYLIRLMHRFDVCFALPNDDHRRIQFVEHLPETEPANGLDWEGTTRQAEHRVSIRYDFDRSIPPGIPTWLIAREHRYATDQRWKYGAVFRDSEDRTTHVLVRADHKRRSLLLEARGSYPWPFYGTLQRSFEDTLRKYPGLSVVRRVPCPCLEAEGSRRWYSYETLKEYVLQNGGGEPACCCLSGTQLDVPRSALAVFGPHLGTLESIQAELKAKGERIDELQRQLDQIKTIDLNETSERAMLRAIFGQVVTSARDTERMRSELSTDLRAIKEQSEQQYVSLARELQRVFLDLVHHRQQSIDKQCPGLFLLQEVERTTIRKALAGRRYRLRLLCEAPGEWHAVDEAEPYDIEQPAEWLTSIAPYLAPMIKVLKQLTPFVSPTMHVLALDLKATINEDLKMMEGLIKELQIPTADSPLSDLPLSDAVTRIPNTGLHQLHEFLEKNDRTRRIRLQGLLLTTTRERESLWLCSRHRSELGLG